MVNVFDLLNFKLIIKLETHFREDTYLYNVYKKSLILQDIEDKNSFYVACTNNFNSLRVHFI